MRGQEILFSHKSDEYITPYGLMTTLKQEFDFMLDACSTDFNPTSMTNYYTKKDDGLKQDWITWTYCNPPYSQIKHWVMKADQEALDGNYSVMLLPARTDTDWFHKCIYEYHEVRFLKGRLKFEGTKYSAPFPSMLVIFK